MKMKNLSISYTVIVLLMLLAACQKETIRTVPEDVPFNPYDTINYGNTPPTYNIDPNSFMGIYNNILSLKCGANDGACHDGTFEPDYRSIQSAYNTLVYQRPIKNIIESINGNDTTWVYPYRVTPGYPDISWLHYRVTTNDVNLGRMPLYDTPLTTAEVNNIRQWILDGAKDAFGNSPVIPSVEPFFFGIVAYVNDVNGVRLDTARATIVDPMIFPANTTVDIWFGVADYTAQYELVFGSELQYNKVRFSNHLYDYSQSQLENLIVMPLWAPHMAPTPFDPNGALLPYYQHIYINTADYATGETVYMRIYVKDVDHDIPTEIPESGSQLYLLTYFSFIVQ
jgi:hypothetical protein